MTPIPQYATWEDHRRALHETADGNRGNILGELIGPRPSIELIEEPESVTVFIELPGFEREDIQLQKDEYSLAVSATRQEYEGTGDTLHSERVSHVKRRIRLPVKTNAEKTEATFENGVLKIILPKEEGQQKSIPIQ